MRKRKKKEVTGRHWIYCFAIVPIQVELLKRPCFLIYPMSYDYDCIIFLLTIDSKLSRSCRFACPIFYVACIDTPMTMRNRCY